MSEVTLYLLALPQTNFSQVDMPGVWSNLSTLERERAWSPQNFETEYNETEPDLQFSIQEQLLRRNVKWFRGRFVFKAHRLLYHSTLGLRVIKKKGTQTLGVLRLLTHIPATSRSLHFPEQLLLFWREGLGGRRFLMS